MGNIITINVGPQSFDYTVQGVDNATGNLSNDPAIYDRAQSKSEIITEIAGIINDASSGSTLVTAVEVYISWNSNADYQKTSGWIHSHIKQTTCGIAWYNYRLTTPVANQSLTYGYYWRQTDAIGTPVSTLDTSDPTTYVDTGLTLNLTSVTGSEYYMLTTVSNNCQAGSTLLQ